ncbi:MAG: arylsulfatase [Pirellulales bacterium]
MKPSATLAALVVLVLGATSSAGAGEVRPNIVVILADDLGIGDLGCYNAESKIPTPHFDRLASEGMRFTDAHTPSSVCTPTRYGLLTGRYCWRTSLKHGVLMGYDPLLIDTKRLTMASLLRRAGYQTAGVGKWHLGLGSRERTDYSQPLVPGPLDVGFDHYFGIPASLDMAPYVYVVDAGLEAAPTEEIDASKHRRQGGEVMWRGGPIAPGFHHIDVLPRIVDESVARIESYAETPETPFFLYVPLSAPHTPWLPIEEFRGSSEAGYYGDFVHQVDAAVGAILRSLTNAGFAENTLLFVTSDNGSHWPVSDIEKYDHRANLHYRGQKADIHEGGHRVPLIVRWPGEVPAASVCDETVCLTDVMATVAAVVGQSLPEDAAEDSFDLLPALLDKPHETIRDATIHHSINGTFAVRVGPWKLIDGLGSGGFTSPQSVEPSDGGPRGQLYNLAEDPTESNNLYLDRPDIVAQLTAVLNDVRDKGFSRPGAVGPPLAAP